MKVSGKVKAFCDVGMNVGVLFFSIVGLIDGVSAERSLIILLASAVWINFMLWLGFRIREKGSL